MELAAGVSAVFAEDGFCVIERVLDFKEVERIKASLEQKVSRDAGRGGVRNLLDLAEMRDLASSAAVRAIVDPVLGHDARAVRGILFDKTSDANWKVPWHQDVTIAVVERVEAEGYGPWSNKGGVLHVQPPASVLERMVTVRLHLDDCPAENGALKVVPGAHRFGKIAESQFARMVERGDPAVCEVGVGGALVMRPLLLHASSASSMPGHRRVLHFDFAAGELAAGMRWAV